MPSSQVLLVVSVHSFCTNLLEVDTQLQARSYCTYDTGKSVKNKFLLTMTPFPRPNRNCAPPYGTPNHVPLWYSLESNQGL